MGLGLRLAVWFASIVALTAIGIGIASFVTTGRQFNKDVDDFLIERAEEILGGNRPRPDGNRNRQDRNDGRVVSVGADSVVQLIDDRGNVLASSGELLPVLPVDTRIASGDVPRLIRTVDVDGVPHRVLTTRLPGGGALQVARSLDSSNLLLDGLRSRLLLLAAGFASIAAIAGWFLAQRVTEPLRALTRSVDSVASTGDLTVAIPTESQDEVGRLARGFERMLNGLQMSRDQQRRLVQDAAHELRTPLTSATANVELLARAPDIEAGERTDMLNGVLRELRELNSIVGEIVELATEAPEMPDLVRLDLADVATEAAIRFMGRTGRNVEQKFSEVYVSGDRESLLRAAGNLLGNADKYSPPKEPIAIEVTNDGWLFVSDNGQGIPADERDLVFDRFYRRVEDRSKPGSGLGLAIVARVVSLHDGETSVTESGSGGARVGFRIPPA